ncbi:MAG: hypothetical protein AB1509_02115 [Chloroflexota bacterium]
MPYFEISSILRTTAVVISLELVLFAALLARRGLFRWLTAGFWAWTAFLVYFVLSPVAASFDDLSMSRLQFLLALSGGIERAFWVLLLILMGIAAFFVTYLRTSYRPVTWKLPPGPLSLNLPALFVLLAFIAFGMYSLLVFRAGLFPVEGEKLILGGRFVGNITGYQNGGYGFLFTPILLLLLSNKRRLQALGGIMIALFLIFSLPHAWSRYMTVSLLLALSMVFVLKRKRRMPPLIWAVVILVFAALYQMRGHSDWRYGQINSELTALIDSFPERASQILSSTDTAMIQAWYVSSYLNDRWVGIDYGLPVLNYALTGWIPSRYFPEKYFIVDWLNARRSGYYPAVFDQVLYGSKSSLMGSFYDHGGWAGVLLGCLLAGYLSRRLDGMLAPETSSLVKSTGITWLSILWMVWASSSTWGMMAIGAMAMPALAVWLFLPKISARRDSKTMSFEPQPGQFRPLER